MTTTCPHDNCTWAKHTHICFWNPCPYNIQYVSCKPEITIPKKTPDRSKPVIQYDLETGDTITVFHSAAEAERQTGISHHGISACITGKQKSASGYGWRLLQGGEPHDV